MPRWDNPEADRGETHTYLVVDEPAALVWAANFGAPGVARVDLAAPTGRACPTYALIDLDPGDETSWEDLLVAGAAAPHGVRAPRRHAPAPR